ncbi:hypothetical protein AHF37_12645 [Paragonimus kellicotti]|nr:hypothetical protein AHF37_12645 [Paragonimus kellicotti]
MSQAIHGAGTATCGIVTRGLNNCCTLGESPRLLYVGWNSTHDCSYNFREYIARRLALRWRPVVHGVTFSHQNSGQDRKTFYC